MEKDFSKDSKNIKPDKNNPKDKSINRFWGNATRLEHINNRNKNKNRKGD